MINRVRRLFAPLAGFLEPSRLFLALGGVVVGLLVFLIPPFQTPDEHTHLYKAMQLASGSLMAEKFSPNQIGERFPREYAETVDQYRYLWGRGDAKISPQAIAADMDKSINSGETAITTFENTAVYPPAGYVPQALAIWLSGAIDSSVLQTLYAARLGGFIAWLLLTYMAIRLLPFGRWAGVVLAMTPISLFLAASASSDAVTGAIVFLFIAVVLRASCGVGRLSYGELAAIVLLVMMLGMVKLPYCLVALLIFIIPAKRFGGQLKYWLLSGIISALPWLLEVAWMAYVKGIFISVYPGSSPGLQIQHILHHPVAGAWAIINTLLFALESDALVIQLIGILGWVDTRLPLWSVILYFLLIVMALATDMPSVDRKLLRLRLRGFTAAIAVSGALMVALLLYLSYTPVGHNVIVGLQGRYFVPFMFLLIPAGYGLLRIHKKASLFMPAAVLLGPIVTLVSLVIRYYRG